MTGTNSIRTNSIRTNGAETSATRASAIRTSGLRKVFGPIEALCGVDLRIPEGALYGLVGPNGSGKTTLYRLLVGLGRPTSGSAEVLGRPAGHREARGKIGYMTQSEALYDDLTVRENVRFFGKLFGLRGEELARRCEEAVEMVALTARVDSRVRTLSGGMRRRASLACATVHRPRLLLLDEPTAGVDPELRSQFWRTFTKWSEGGTTLVIATHHMEEAHRCHRLGLLREGRIIAEGVPAELLRESGHVTMEDAFRELAGRFRP